MTQRLTGARAGAWLPRPRLEQRVQPGQIGITHVPAFDIPQDAAQPLAVELALSCQVIEEVTYPRAGIAGDPAPDFTDLL
jgi:hypothetical protein